MNENLIFFFLIFFFSRVPLQHKNKGKNIQKIKRANNPCEADNKMKDLVSEAESFQTKEIDMLLFLHVSKLLW